ncbi:MAG: cupredoxin domain-containing protein [Candidatus Parcubacteria bacterium]|nr:cupredoxin domain-containing protein [Candidatus Parcubacteria bacterium]
MKKSFIIVIILVMAIIIGGCNLPFMTQYSSPAVNKSPSPVNNQNANVPVTPPTANLNQPVTPPPANVSEPAQPKTVAVQIMNFAFNPATLTIKVNDTVKWTNNDSVPHAIAGTGFGSSTLNNGETYSNIFNQVGIYDYHCSIHPSMTGQIIVTQ